MTNDARIDPESAKTTQTGFWWTVRFTKSDGRFLSESVWTMNGRDDAVRIARFRNRI